MSVLAKTYTNFTDVERLARVVPVSEIEANGFNLNISRYVHLGEEAAEVDVALEVQKLIELQAERNAAEARMMGFLMELGYVA